MIILALDTASRYCSAVAAPCHGLRIVMSVEASFSVPRMSNPEAWAGV